MTTLALLTLNAKVTADDETQAVLLDAMLSATKVYNGLLWHLRNEFERTGKTKATRKYLNAILKTLPRARSYYSLSVQATRDELIQAYSSFYALRAAGRTQHQMPGFRPKTCYSPLRYFEGKGFKISAGKLILNLGKRRPDGLKQITVKLDVRQDVTFKRIRNVLLTYDKDAGLCAHLVVEVGAKEPLGHLKVAVDLGETQAITAVFDNGTALLFSGRLIKSIRRYWQKIRANVKPPSATNRRMSRRFRQIAHKELRQTEHLLHMMTTDFVHRCWLAKVDTIAIGNLTGVLEGINRGKRLNQRLHAWPFAKIVRMITYKAALYGIQVAADVDEAYSSTTCHRCGEINRSYRRSRGEFRCGCGWAVQADVNAACNIFARAFNVSPLRSSGAVAAPVVVPVRLGRHTVHEATGRAATAA